ncbi:DUF2599 domain-containing protein [Mycobacterium sp. 852002-51057_SCH5723018]|uniref:DUF2599 domain-containing protein n=1 Tax=Mycobacterium sp. 852002-51057_SCH5723018 TaxID=1834094 RepID=UPI0007FC0970|nr:DUF2599 domain-containing protein [Mycobacterium sp. 852002-51057_SCH5723018]OBG23340.1 hypothetical protein A5764_11340 [Mycobacterium sp. 852002-51057_SCH5723018]
MKPLLAAPAAVLVALLGPPAAVADPGAGAASPSGPWYLPPFVDHVEWTQWNGLSSLRVFPTPSARMAARHPGAGVDRAPEASADEAWAEVLALAPAADTPGMRAQFVCHWQFAELAQPGKSSWNLEPWRPVVDDAEMFASGCNPGGPEEAF